MQPHLTDLCPSPRLTRTVSTAQSTRTIYFSDPRPRRSVEAMLREIATVLHYTRVCRDLRR
jgi:hypothetical protein